METEHESVEVGCSSCCVFQYRSRRTDIDNIYFKPILLTNGWKVTGTITIDGTVGR
jgi:hypothetical protein